MDEIDNFFAELSKKNDAGTLTVGEATFGYYRLLEGEHAGRVIIKTSANIDDKPVFYFANQLTWAYVEKYKDTRCEAVRPFFSEGKQPIDRSQATWYPDNSSEPMYYEW